jgi:hypothetical protein
MVLHVLEHEILRPTLIARRCLAKTELKSVLTFSFAKHRLIVKSDIRRSQATKKINRISQE